MPLLPSAIEAAAEPSIPEQVVFGERRWFRMDEPTSAEVRSEDAPCSEAEKPYAGPGALANAVARHQQVVRMQVKATAHGRFDSGHPSTVFRLVSLEVIRGQELEQRSFFIALPSVERSCGTDTLFPREPVNGEELLLFFDRKQLSDEGVISLAPIPDLIVLGKDDRIALSPHLEHDLPNYIQSIRSPELIQKHIARLSAWSDGQDDPEIPETIWDESRRPRALWATIDAAFEPDGSLRGISENHDGFVSLLDGLAADLPTDSCLEVQHFRQIDGGDTATSLSEALQEAQRVELFEVMASKLGLFREFEPGTLFSLEPLGTLRGETQPRQPTLIFFPVGTLKIGSRRVCKSDPRYPALPAIGDKLVVLTDASSDQESRSDWRLLFTGQYPEIFVIRDDHHLSTPSRFHENQLESFEDFLTMIDRDQR